MSDVTDTLQALRDGSISLDDAADQFSQRQWPVRLAHQPAAYPDLFGTADPEPEPDGGFGEVEAAYAAGWITDAQYQRLAEAAATAMSRAGGSSPAEAKGLPPVGSGSYVSWPGGKGRIDMVVTSGTVPGVDEDVTGTPDAPAARVVIWEKGDSGWAASSRKTAVKLSALTRMPPLHGGGARSGESKDAALVAALAEHEERVTAGQLPGYAVPGARAVLTVYDRGEASWPGETKTVLSRDDWALARVGAFLDLAAGEQLPGYVRDTDLLPAGHPARS